MAERIEESMSGDLKIALAPASKNFREFEIGGRINAINPVRGHSYEFNPSWDQYKAGSHGARRGPLPALEGGVHLIEASGKIQTWE